MDNQTLFYVFGIAAAVSAVAVTFAGLKLNDFPGKALPALVLWFTVLVVGAATFSVLHAQDEEHHKEAEHHEAAEKIEEGKTPGPYDNEGGALGGESEELEEEAEEEGEGSPGEEPVGPTEGSKSSAQASETTLALAADPAALLFDKEELSAKPGKVTIDFDNPSAIPHNVVIEEDGKELAGFEPISEGEKSVSAELEPGTYDYICTVPGHAEAGMVGTLTVE
jgi:plastocyanin